VFYVFQNQMIAASAVEGIVTGTAHYQNTGRPTFFDTYSKTLAYKLYCNSHYYPALSIMGLFFFISFITPNAIFSTTLMFLGLIGFSWLSCPIVFVAQVDVWQLFRDDTKAAWVWLFSITDQGKESFFEFWKLDSLRARSVDAWVTAFFDLLFGVVQALILFRVCSASAAQRMLGFAYVVGLHMIATVVWHFFRTWKSITAIWLAFPIVATSTLIILPDQIDQQLLLPKGRLSENLLGIALAGAFLRTIPLLFRFLCTTFIRLRRKGNAGRDVEHPKYNAALSFLYLLVPFYHFHFYCAAVILAIQSFVHFAILVLCRAFKPLLCRTKLDFARRALKDPGNHTKGEGVNGSGNNSPEDSPRVLANGPQITELVPELKL